MPVVLMIFYTGSGVLAKPSEVTGGSSASMRKLGILYFLI
jgi:hypothetical protein